MLKHLNPFEKNKIFKRNIHTICQFSKRPFVSPPLEYLWRDWHPSNLKRNRQQMDLYLNNKLETIELLPYFHDETMRWPQE